MRAYLEVALITMATMFVLNNVAAMNTTLHSIIKGY